MTPRALGRLLGAYAFAIVMLALLVRSYAELVAPVHPVVIVSRWRGGQRISRETRATPPAGAVSETLLSAALPPGVTEVEERVVGEGPMWSAPLLFGLALVPAKDGLRAELDGKTVWLTVDDLLVAQVYDRGTALADASTGIGTHRGAVLHLLAQELGVLPAEVLARATLTRVRFERLAPVPPKRVTAETVTRELVIEAVREAAGYLARHVSADGRFDYLLVATTLQSIPGYSWPRHAGATYFLAQAAALLDDPVIRFAALRAAALMRDATMVDCGDARCIATDDDADVGSSALGLLAFSEIVRTGADASYRRAIGDLARFLRGQQRPDGEMMHVYRRSLKQPLDVQYLYYTGEAALGLARAHRVTNDPADLDAARRALAHLAGPGWSFFGSRYFFSEEHWTCQAMADLWERAPSDDALAFCLRWHQYQRAIQYRDGEAPFDGDGAFGFGPIVTPRLTPASSRGEAAGATLEVARTRPALADEATALEEELRHAIAFVLREQFRPGPTWLFSQPGAVRGAMPGSVADWQLRIDYEQHAGSMMIRWLELNPGRSP